MAPTGTVVVGDLVLKALPELECFTNFTDFLKALPSLYAVEVPSTVTNVIVGPSQPTSSQTSSVWIRTDSSGGFIGVYVFSQGQWRLIIPGPQQIFWLYGDSSAPPAGYITTDEASGNQISTTLATALKALWIAGDKAGPPFEYFSALFSGF